MGISYDHFIHLKSVFNPKFEEIVLRSTSTTNGDYSDLTHFYAMYLDCLELSNSHVTNFYPAKIFNSANSFQSHFESAFAFIHHYFTKVLGYGEKSAKRIFTDLVKLFQVFSDAYGVPLSIPSSNTAKGAYKRKLLSDFNLTAFNQYKFNLYKGWTSKVGNNGTLVYFHLGYFYHKFGQEFTSLVFKAFVKFLTSYSTRSIKSQAKTCNQLIKYIEREFSTLDELKNGLSQSNVNRTFELLLARACQEKIDLGSSCRGVIRKWSTINFIYENVFVEHLNFAPPPFPLIAPPWRSYSSATKRAKVDGVEKTQLQKILCNIPDHIDNDEAFNIIKHELNSKIEFIEDICIHEIKSALKHASDIQKLPLDNFLRVTYGRCKLVPKVKYDKFWKEAKIHGIECITELNKQLPIVDFKLLCFVCSILVKENPQITPSWICNWKMFNKKGEIVGLQKVNGNYYGISLKPRRGIGLADQKIKLTRRSAALVKTLIKATSRNREILKSHSNPNWRYLFIYSNSLTLMPRVIGTSENVILFSNNVYDHLDNEAIISKHNMNVEQVKEIKDSYSLRSVRASQAIIVYINTRSIHAMRDALGHTINSGTTYDYLPEPLADFVNENTIRIYQNIIIVCALENDPLLFEALNYDIELITSIFNNKVYKNVSTRLKKMKSDKKSHNIDVEIDELTLLISIPLLQVLIGIRDLTNSIDSSVLLNQKMEYWVTLSDCILGLLESKSRYILQRNSDIEKMLNIAMKNPIPATIFNEFLLEK